MATRKAATKKAADPKTIKPKELDGLIKGVIKQLEKGRKSAEKAFKITETRAILQAAADSLETVITKAHGDDGPGGEPPSSIEG